MMDSTLSDQKENNKDIPPPNWKVECIVSIRSLWEISAMAGNVAPKIALVRKKKSIDQKWSHEYNMRISAMRKALQSDSKKFGDFVYFDPQLEVNSMIVKDEERTKIDLKRLQVDVISAIEFLWNRYVEEIFPEGLKIVHQELKKRINNLASKASEEKKNHDLFDSGKNKSIESSANRQDKANKTKEINRLYALLYIVSCVNYKFDPDMEYVGSDLGGLILDDIQSVGFEKFEGFGEHSIKKIVDKSFEAYWAMKNKNKGGNDV